MKSPEEFTPLPLQYPPLGKPEKLTPIGRLQSIVSFGTEITGKVIVSIEIVSELVQPKSSTTFK